MQSTKENNSPGKIFAEYEAGVRFKASLGSRGLYEQNKINERFYTGDQWFEAKCGKDRPLVRYNIIKRIGEYKMASIGTIPIAVNYRAEGIPDTLTHREQAEAVRAALRNGGEDTFSGDPTPQEISLILSGFSDFFKTTAERVEFDRLREQALRNAYITGTGVIYSYWDESAPTGLYADREKRCPILGDVSCEVLDIENVYFGEPNNENIQTQPYIILAQRKTVAEVRREAKRNGRTAEELSKITPDRSFRHMAGDISSLEPEDSKRILVLTKLYKAWSRDLNDYEIRAVRVCRDVVIREDWSMGIRLYPLACFLWERRHSCAYGESEITWLVPNQIAINRMLTASVWSGMMMGMPIMVVDGDLVDQPVTNDPAQIIRVQGGGENVSSAVQFVNPPEFSGQFGTAISSLIEQTLTQAGANAAALGDIAPNNTSAIIALREAATMPMQLFRNRFFSFCEDVARIWGELWLSMYGKRSLRIEDEGGVWYLPFDGARYRNLILNTRIDVGAASAWSELASVKILDGLFEKGVITAEQYLERLPKGTVPGCDALLRRLRADETIPLQEGGQADER
ncbi:MAG: hypothetical protein IJY82_03225 [Oscillospiraceae bacterium]|nr:hypothetical protein [Oscillospiraceae bacterium]